MTVGKAEARPSQPALQPSSHFHGRDIRGVDLTYPCSTDFHQISSLTPGNECGLLTFQSASPFPPLQNWHRYAAASMLENGADVLTHLILLLSFFPSCMASLCDSSSCFPIFCHVSTTSLYISGRRVSAWVLAGGKSRGQWGNGWQFLSWALTSESSWNTFRLGLGIRRHWFFKKGHRRNTLGIWMACHLAIWYISVEPISAFW